MNKPHFIYLKIEIRIKVEGTGTKLQSVRKTINHFFSLHTEPDQQHLSHKNTLILTLNREKYLYLNRMKEFHLGDEKKKETRKIRGKNYQNDIRT